jgi:hypothetical protein
MHYEHINPFSFIRGLFCPSSVQTSLSQNCLKLTIPRFPHNLLPACCGDIGLLLLGRSCPLQTIQLSDLVKCDSPLQIVTGMAILRFFKFEARQTIIVSSRLPHPTQQVQIKEKWPNCYYYLQQAVTPAWIGSIAF